MPCQPPRMTLKQQTHDLVDDLPDDSPPLAEVREALRMNHAGGAGAGVDEAPGALFEMRMRPLRAPGITTISNELTFFYGK